MERKVKEGGGSLLTKRIDLREQFPLRRSFVSVQRFSTRFPSSVKTRCSRALSTRGKVARHLFQAERDGCIRLPPGPAARFSFFNSGRKTFYNDLLGNRFLPSLLRKGAHLCAKLSFSLFLFFSDHRQFRRRYEVVYPHSIRRWKCGCHVEVTLSRLIIRRVTVFIGYSGFKRWHNRKAFLRDEEKGECFSRRTRYANVRDVKKRFFRFLPSFFF